MMAIDKTGAETTVSLETDRFTISVEGRPAGFTEFADRDGQRVFIHTEIAPEFGGRGLATILVGEALETTKSAGLRVVAVCGMVAAYLKKHAEFTDIVDPATPAIKEWLTSAS
jgi:uncharacterized protein